MSPTTTEAPKTWGSPAGVPPSAPVQAAKLWPPRMRSTAAAHGPATSWSRDDRVATGLAGHHSTPSCSSATTHRAPSPTQLAGERLHSVRPIGGGRRRARVAVAVGARQADDADGAGRGFEQARRGQADVHVGAQQREGQPARGLEQRVDAVVELVVAGRGGGDRQGPHNGPPAVAPGGGGGGCA